MKTLVKACLGAILLLAAGCSMTKESQRSDQPSLEEELQLPFCEQKNAWFFDQNGDFEFNTGDRITYVISFGELDQVGKVDCSTSKGSFYGSEEIVEKLSAVGGEARYLTTFQGTAMLPNGNLKLMAMGVIRFPKTELLKMTKTSQQKFKIESLFPEAHPASVQGQGGDFAGLIGTASLQSGQPPELKIKLYRQVTFNR